MQGIKETLERWWALVLFAAAIVIGILVSRCNSGKSTMLGKIRKKSEQAKIDAAMTTIQYDILKDKIAQDRAEEGQKNEDIINDHADSTTLADTVNSWSTD